MSAIYTTAEEAEDAFYDALGRGDLETLMGIWANDDEIVCIHPTGQSLTGLAAIRESWRMILSGNTRFTLRIKRKVCWKGVMFAVHSVVDFLDLDNEPRAHGPMLSTNVFQHAAEVGCALHEWWSRTHGALCVPLSASGAPRWRCPCLAAS